MKQPTKRDIDRLNEEPPEPIYLASVQRPRDGARFAPAPDGLFIDDNDFIYDAILRIGGDFASDKKRRAYAQWICDALNAADRLLPRKALGEQE